MTERSAKPDQSRVDERRVERSKAAAARREQQRSDAAPSGRRAPDREEA